MSISVYVKAQKQLSKSDFEKVSLYNKLVEEEYPAPEELFAEVQTILGVKIYKGEPIPVPSEKVIEIGLDGEGDVMYGDGLLIQVSSLPVNTVALRVYASS